MITIYSKPNCINCIKVKNILQTNNLPFIELILDVDYSREDLLKLNPTARTMPQLYHNGIFLDFNQFVRGEFP